jgi:hypothetical protein
VSNDIVPDTKNWTWVLEKRCDDGRFDLTVDSLARYLMHDPVHHLWDVQAAEAP